ncbi:Cytochrome c551 peroxidase precursor [Enhygromyxa salina]|uniref:Cytochrome c551 peroxidase n=1 Tax=Enhygromyxa salina TaxID=215803 RepID=A0A2S9XBN6_9BACT|nr:methanobactin export MATE transporter MbnM [Enhygromyxa salina]PRP90101.1 Cytochrome c551 peroxidase precursor [Enhygromyxa salina]
MGARGTRRGSSTALAIAALAALVCGSACGGDDVDVDAHDHDHDHGDAGEEAGGSADGADLPFELPEGFPAPAIPEDNELTAAKIELGRYLFYDEQLSANATQSCGSCHLQELAFTDGAVTPEGSTGELLVRNSLGLTNSGYTSKLTWANPNLDTLEQQILIPMFGEFPVELGITGHEDEVLARFAEDPEYVEMFEAAFPDAEELVSFENIVKALASFIRTLVSGDSPYDRWRGGDEGAISESAKRGGALFFSEELECHHCHGGFNFSLATRHANTTFTQSAFQNTGLYDIDGMGGYPAGNRGLYEFTFVDQDMGRFRPPSLRNVAVTAPYMHDGSVATLAEVVDIYAAGGRLIPEGEPWAGDGRASPYKSGFVMGFELSEQDRADLVAFLESLTDDAFLTDPATSNPFE